MNLGYLLLYSENKNNIDFILIHIYRDLKHHGKYFGMNLKNIPISIVEISKFQNYRKNNSDSK